MKTCRSCKWAKLYNFGDSGVCLNPTEPTELTETDSGSSRKVYRDTWEPYEGKIKVTCVSVCELWEKFPRKPKPQNKGQWPRTNI